MDVGFPKSSGRVKQLAREWGTRLHEVNPDGSITVVPASQPTAKKAAQAARRVLPRTDRVHSPSSPTRGPRRAPPKPPCQRTQLNPRVPRNQPKEQPDRSTKADEPPSPLTRQPYTPPPTLNLTGKPVSAGNSKSILSPRTKRRIAGIREKVTRQSREAPKWGKALLTRRNSDSSPPTEFTLRRTDQPKVDELSLPQMRVVKVSKRTTATLWAMIEKDLKQTKQGWQDLGPVLMALNRAMSGFTKPIPESQEMARVGYEAMTQIRMACQHQEHALNHSLNALEVLCRKKNPNYPLASTGQQKCLEEISKQVLESFYPKMKVLVEKLQEPSVQIFVEVEGKKTKVGKDKLIQGINTFFSTVFEKPVTTVLSSERNGKYLEDNRSHVYFGNLLEKWPLWLHSNSADFSVTCNMMEHYLKSLNTLTFVYLSTLNENGNLDELQDTQTTPFKVIVEKRGQTVRVAITDLNGAVKEERNAEDLLAQLGKELATYGPPLEGLVKGAENVCNMRQAAQFPHSVEKNRLVSFKKLQQVWNSLREGTGDTPSQSSR